MFTTATESATITGVSANGTNIVYTAANTFAVGDIVHVSGISPSNFNIPDAVVTARSSTNFTIASTETGTYVSGGTAIYDELKNHTATSSVIRTNTAVIAEWNLNSADNIAKIGNYRYRPDDSGSAYYTIATAYDSSDASNNYTNATFADVLVDGGLEDDGTPYFTTLENQKQRLLFSLEDCFGKNRPRSGINKLINFPGRNINFSNENMALRPRYYVASRDDKFKYWCSYRKEVVSNVSKNRGISKNDGNGNYIDDAAPFVVYETEVPSNRVVVKMQTHVGTYQAYANDPFYGDANKLVPSDWKIQRLNLSNNWETLKDSDGSDITLSDTDIPENGYVELEYGLNTDSFTGYESTFFHAGEYSTSSDLPIMAPTVGYAYLVGADTSNAGTYYIYNGGTSTTNTDNYDDFTAKYGWKIHNESIDRFTPFVTDLTSPSYYTSGSVKVFRELQFVKGLRVVVSKMKKPNATLDLIELSPRLVVDLSGKTENFSVRKHGSDLGSSGMPVGKLLAGSGTLNLFDYDQAFNPNNVWTYASNTGSIISSFISKNLQVKLYEIIRGVNGSDYYVPIKTMNCLGFPQYDTMSRNVSLELRDQYLMLESMTAPQVFVPDASLSYAVSVILDSIGFSNYIFKRVDNVAEPVIPFFFVGPNTSVAEILQEIAVSTQSMMFFDEFNNFVVMSKEYAMPTESQRSTDYVLYGSQDYTESSVAGELGVKTNTKKLSNIVQVASKVHDIYNDGKINYSARYIQKSPADIRQAYAVDIDKTWIYKPTLLWEATGEDTTKSTNGANNMSEGYALTAIPLNSPLSSAVPEYVAATTGLIATLTSGSTTVTLTTGSTSNLVIGQSLTKTSGTGAFGSGAKISEIVSGTVFKTTVAHQTNGSTTFKTDGIIKNNIISFGDSVYWMPRYNGYFYANGEVIKYDAVEYVVQGIGNVWIKDKLEYENYFSKLGFGKKIYPSGKVRIYSKLDSTPSVVRHGRGQFGTDIVSHTSGISSHWTNASNRKGFVMKAEYLFEEKTLPASLTGGAIGNPAAASTIKGKATSSLKNSLLMFPNEADWISKTKSSLGGSVKASALVLTGASKKDLSDKNISGKNFITYVHKQLDNKFVHFGTRVRIVGSLMNNKYNKDLYTQKVQNATTFYNGAKIDGGSAGLAFMLDTTSSKNNGYYFEIAALGFSNVDDFKIADNVFFYKVQKESGAAETASAIPVTLFKTTAQIVVDAGSFVTQGRLTTEEIPTVYDLAVEYEKISSKWLRFYLYINGTLIGVVDDKDALPVKKNIAMFVRGSTKAIFENVYAMRNSYENSGSSSIEVAPGQSTTIFDDNYVSVGEALKKYAISGIIQQTYLTKLGPDGSKYKIYYDEFGTIFREAAYFDIKYDKAYPALFAKLVRTFSKEKGYTVSGFNANAYGAEFLLFNATDNVVMIDQGVGNMLRISGIALTDESNKTLTVDDYYNKRADFSNPAFSGNSLVTQNLYEEYLDIKNSRTTYGIKSFEINPIFIQSQDSANELMGWLISKISKPRNAVGIEVFGVPYAQLGDIVKVDYIKDGVDQVSLTDSRYVVYSIEYGYDFEGPKTMLYLSEVQ
jgi:hypothetical protein